VYRRNEEVDKAIAEYEKALSIDATLADAWYDLGHMYRLDHNNDKAIEAFYKYLALTKGKNPKSDAFVKEQIEALGGSVDDAAPKKNKKRKK